MDRVLGRIEGTGEGPVVVCVAALHGNEIRGIDACNEVFRSIENEKIPVKGKFIGVLGNIGAYRARRRFITEDLNRIWTEERIGSVLDGDPISPDAAEMVKVQQVIKEETQKYRRKILIDLHSTSSANGNFMVCPDERSTGGIASALHLTKVYGLQEQLEGLMVKYYQRRGFETLVFEGGAIGKAQTTAVHTAALWETLRSVGCIDRTDRQDPDHYKKVLLEISLGLPDVVKTVYRHAIAPQDRFEMLPGYVNFQHVKKGEKLGKDRFGNVYAPDDGMIFMPLYQPQGDDGFFLVRECSGSPPGSQ